MHMAILINMVILMNLKKGYTIYDMDDRYFFTSDTHFGSQRTLDLSKRPFSSVEEMDEFMINEWNKAVSKDDTVIHLGDFGDLKVRERLNGNLILIQGNYEEEIPDREVINSLGKKDVYITGEGKDHAYLTINEENCTYIAIHRPVDCLLKDDEKDPSKKFFLFGHIHGRQFIKEFGIDVGVDANHFRPMPWKDVLFYQNAIVKKYYDENVFC